MSVQPHRGQLHASVALAAAVIVGLAACGEALAHSKASGTRACAAPAPTDSDWKVVSLHTRGLSCATARRAAQGYTITTRRGSVTCDEGTARPGGDRNRRTAHLDVACRAPYLGRAPYLLTFARVPVSARAAVCGPRTIPDSGPYNLRLSFGRTAGVGCAALQALAVDAWSRKVTEGFVSGERYDIETVSGAWNCLVERGSDFLALLPCRQGDAYAYIFVLRA